MYPNILQIKKENTLIKANINIKSINMYTLQIL